MHYMISAGEASGDLHAAQLIRELRARDHEARFSFLGGDKMAAAAGCEPLIHISKMAYMGFTQVLLHLPDVLRNMRAAKRVLREQRPDALILVDYPSFNLKIAAYAHKLGIPVHYYIPPKVWAWKEWRVRKIRKVVDRLYAILPFEPDFYRKHGMEVEYVGNPSVEEMQADLAAAPPRAQYLTANRLRDRKIVALLPGSRVAEIRSNLQVMCQVMKQFPQYRGVIAGAPGMTLDFYRQFTDLPVVTSGTADLLAHSHAALITSGTATLEGALARVPQVVTYRANGSKLAYKAMKKLLKIKYVSLPNLIADGEVIPEQLLHLCTPDLVAERLAPLLTDTPQRQMQQAGYSVIAERLGQPGAAARTATLIVDSLLQR